MKRGHNNISNMNYPVLLVFRGVIKNTFHVGNVCQLLSDVPLIPPCVHLCLFDCIGTLEQPGPSRQSFHVNRDDRDGGPLRSHHSPLHHHHPLSMCIWIYWLTVRVRVIMSPELSVMLLYYCIISYYPHNQDEEAYQMSVHMRWTYSPGNRASKGRSSYLLYHMVKYQF